MSTNDTNPPDTSRLDKILAKLPPEQREKAIAAVAEIGAVMAAYHPDKLRAGPPAKPIATPAAKPAATAAPGPEWKVSALFHIANKAISESAKLDNVILPAIARQPKSQRQTQRDLNALRDAWEVSFGARQALLDLLGKIVAANTADELVEMIPPRPKPAG